MGNVEGKSQKTLRDVMGSVTHITANSTDRLEKYYEISPTYKMPDEDSYQIETDIKNMPLDSKS